MDALSSLDKNHASSHRGRPITVRAMNVPVDADVPKHWAFDSALLTHIANGVNLLFPAGERFFIRSVRRYMDQITDQSLKDQIKGFFGQEGRHSKAHEDYFKILEKQGFELDKFMEFYQWLAYEIIEKNSSPELCLAVTVALEHYTAIMAENALRDRYLDQCHPVIRNLLLWHASEEIEHKSVAFDVLKQVNPSYSLRMAGMALATVALAGFWASATTMLLAQEPNIDWAATLKQFRDRPKEESIGRRVFLKGLKAYARRDFHPSDIDNSDLAETFLNEIKLAAVSLVSSLLINPDWPVS